MCPKKPCAPPQTASTLIAIFGFNGYEPPRDSVDPCQVSAALPVSTLQPTQFWSGSHPGFGSATALQNCLAALPAPLPSSGGLQVRLA